MKIRKHKCQGSIEAQIIIRYCEGGVDCKKQWRLFNLEYDYENPFDLVNPDLNEICSIKYCPFCGKELSNNDDE